MNQISYSDMFWIFFSLLPVGILGHGSLVDFPFWAAQTVQPMSTIFVEDLGTSTAQRLGGGGASTLKHILDIGVKSVENNGVQIHKIMKLWEANMQME